VKRYLPVLLVGALAGCGSSGSNPASSHNAATTAASGHSTLTTTITASPSTTASASNTSGATTTASGGAAVSVSCRATNLSLSYVGENDGAGHGLLEFSLKNTGSTPCQTSGFPGVQFLDSHGADLTTVPHHITSDYFGPAPEGEVTITPGQIASFRIGVTHGAIPGSVCTTAYGLQVIPPDDTATLRASFPRGAYECQDADVSPIEPGSTAYGQ
jgi:hypothetical protein